MNNKAWTVKDSDHLYQVSRWSEGHFGICKDGNFCVYPNKSKDEKIIVKDIIADIQKNTKLQLPIVLRFHDVLRSRIQEFNNEFRKKISEYNYEGSHFGVYPIKVNQLREVVEEVMDVGMEYNYGLEAGSKAELLSVLANNTNQDALTICNGYKDQEFFKLALLGRNLGRKVIIVIEKFSELTDLIETTRDSKVEPIIGIRAKLSSRGSGKWAESTGEFAKFGLTPMEVLEAVELLKKEDKLHWLKLFHFHIGSQIPDIRTIRDSLSEGARIYSHLIKTGCDIEYFDVGGGAGLNYDGSMSKKPSSVNYNLSDYIDTVVKTLSDICNLEKVKKPNIVTEAGRALTAHHSMVITNVFGKSQMTKTYDIDTAIYENDHYLLKQIKLLQKKLSISNYQEVYNEAFVIKEDTINSFKLGSLDLKTRAHVESLFWDLCEDIILLTEKLEYVPDEIKNLKNSYTDTYLCNLSVFQSAPDAWAIGQILPVVPIDRLNQKPDNPCTIADITCDSDGKIDHFLAPQGSSNTILLHDIEPNEKYHIALCLTGAYQDTMGDMHNLFGRLNEAHIYFDDEEPQNFYIEETIQGSSTADVLKIMQYAPDRMCGQIKHEIDAEIKKGNLKAKHGARLLEQYANALRQYTYLDMGTR
jgi:arginine decarboxylase